MPMKKIFLFFFLLTSLAFAQQIDSLRKFEAERLELNNNGLLILGVWAVTNLISGSAGSLTASGDKKYFHQFNAMWNVVNLAIAAGGYYSNLNTDLSAMSREQIFSEYSWLQSFYLLNAGLDAAYIMGGFYLLEKSKNSINNRDRLKGYGYSLFVQGGFLFIFDVLMYKFNLQHAKNNLYPYLATQNTDGLMIGLMVNF